MARHVLMPRIIRLQVQLRLDLNFQLGIRIRLLTPVAAV
jgi:hypothetical protein